MPLFNQNDFFNLVKDPQILSVLGLTEREQQIVFMHTVKGFSFEFIGSVFKISKQAAHKTYHQSLKKMRNSIFEMLKDAANPNPNGTIHPRFPY